MKRTDTKKRIIEDELERRKMKRRKDMDEFKVVEGVIDPPTLKALYKLLNHGVIQALHGAISTGKEANIYRGENSEGKALAVKVYRVSTAESDYMREYIVGDPRFRRVGRKPRTLIPQWAMKEYKNLKRYTDAQVRVPKPIEIERNVLVMEFIGDDDTGIPAPLLKDVKVPSPVDVFDNLMEMVQIGYNKAGLVHADLSEFNVLWWNGPVLIDVSQSVLINHPGAIKYLYRDIKNLTTYFRKLGVETEDPKEILKQIVSSEE